MEWINKTFTFKPKKPSNAENETIPPTIAKTVLPSQPSIYQRYFIREGKLNLCKRQKENVTILTQGLIQRLDNAVDKVHSF